MKDLNKILLGAVLGLASVGLFLGLSTSWRAQVSFAAGSDYGSQYSWSGTASGTSATGTYSVGGDPYGLYGANVVIQPPPTTTPPTVAPTLTFSGTNSGQTYNRTIPLEYKMGYYIYDCFDERLRYDPNTIESWAINDLPVSSAYRVNLSGVNFSGHDAIDRSYDWAAHAGSLHYGF